MRVVMQNCLRFYENVPLTTVPYSARYFTSLGHGVRVVMQSLSAVLRECTTNNDALFSAIFYISRP